MRISAIQNYQSNKSFLGEKKNKLKNAAGAAAIALATTAPITDAKAQYYYIPPITPITTTYIPGTVPDCFVIGDLKNFNGEKSQKQIFNEILFTARHDFMGTNTIGNNLSFGLHWQDGR